MINLTDINKCTGCSACEQICSVSAIKMTRDKEGFLFPVIDEKTCVSCKKCISACPVENPFENTQPKKVYATRAKDEDIVNRSSSGGMFGTFANRIIDDGGAVFGVGFDEDMKIIHKCATVSDEIKELMGSKYVQSDLRDTYKKVKEYLLEDRKVLFSGTSCQCAGLKKFLGKDYDNLIMVDFVCHGVPSPTLFENYLSYMSKKEKVTKVRFRDKTTDKKCGLCISLEYENAPVYRVPFVEDPYMLAFLQNISLRKSCYNCGFKNFSCGSDITIGDFWGIDKTDSFLKNQDGISLCTLNTEKGARFFDCIEDEVYCDVRTLEEASRENPPIKKPVSPNPLREKYLKDMKKLDIKKLNDKYCSSSISAKLRRFIARI